MDGSTMSTAHKTARAGPFLRGFTNSPWTGQKPANSITSANPISQPAQGIQNSSRTTIAVLAIAVALGLPPPDQWLQLIHEAQEAILANGRLKSLLGGFI
jgi:hypothetical protein